MTLPTPSATESTTLGARLAHAIADRDSGRLCSLLATPVVFRAVTPRRFWDAELPMDVVDIILGVWFDATKTITRFHGVETGTVGDVQSVRYRMDVDVASVPSVIEQVAYYSHQGGRITDLRLVCSGFRPA
jgi:hypothetical protein